MVNVFHRPTTVADDGRYMLVRKADTEAEANEWITSQSNPEDFYFVPVVKAE